MAETASIAEALKLMSKPTDREIDEQQKLENEINAKLEKLKVMAEERAEKLYEEMEKLKQQQAKAKNDLEYPDIDIETEFEDKPHPEAFDEDEEFERATQDSIERLKKMRKEERKRVHMTERHRAEIIKNHWSIFCGDDFELFNQKRLAETYVKYLTKRYSIDLVPFL